MKGLYNYIIVKIEKEYEDEVTLADGTKLAVATFDKLQSVQNHNDLYYDPKHDEVIYNPNDHKRLYGTVVAVPDYLTPGDMPIYFGENPKELSPEAQRTYELDYKFRDSIKMDVQVGDKLYFLHTENNRDQTWFEENGQNLLKIDYKNAVCVVREGKVIPVGGYVLVEPYYGKDVHKIELQKGTFIYTQKSKMGLDLPVTNPLKNCGIIKHVGEPLDGLLCDVETETIAQFPEQYAIKMPIENKDYLVMYQHELLAIIEE